MHKFIITFICLSVAGAVNAGDPVAGKNKTMTCIACHGFKGISANNEWPNLAGQKKGYLVNQMKAFRDGTRTDPVMSGMLKGLNDEDFENIATYFSEL
ncbi:MAG: c-type cytochrome [Gammaproteobacteria bacterium]